MPQLVTQNLLFLGLVIVGDAYQGLIAGRPQAALHGLHQVNKQRVREHRNQHRHMVAIVRGQGACRRVGHVAELVDRGLDARRERRVDRALATQRARHGDGADPGELCHIGQRDAAGGAGAGR